TGDSSPCQDQGTLSRKRKTGEVAVADDTVLLGKLREVMAAVDAFYKERGIFQGRFGFGQSPALVVIDMAYGWTVPAAGGGSARLTPALAAIQQLLPVVRQKGVPVIYTTSPYRDKPSLKSAADFSPSFRRWDRRACEIDERVAPLPDEYV